MGIRGFYRAVPSGTVNPWKVTIWIQLGKTWNPISIGQAKVSGIIPQKYWLFAGATVRPTKSAVSNYYQ